jgi:hypothetical protein
MVMGFTLPFVLAFVAIPLESFIHSARTVSGLLGVWLLHMLVVFIRFTGNVINGISKTIINAYDLLIFIPLKVENALINKRTAKPVPAQQQAPSDTAQTKQNETKAAEIAETDTDQSK